MTVVLQFLNSKCVPVLLYSLEACPLLTSDILSVDVVIVRFLMKLFNTTNTDIINNCRQYFVVKLPSTLWSDRVRRFEKKFANVTICLAEFRLNSIVYIYLLVQFLFCLHFRFFMFICYQLWQIKMYNRFLVRHFHVSPEGMTYFNNLSEFHYQVNTSLVTF